MALIKCPECGKEISDKAQKCIHCGTTLAIAIKSNAENEIKNTQLEKENAGLKK